MRCNRLFLAALVPLQHCIGGGACRLRGHSSYWRILVFSGRIIAALVHLAFLVIMIITIVKAFMGVRWDIPYIGPIARKQVEGGGTA